MLGPADYEWLGFIQELLAKFQELLQLLAVLIEKENAGILGKYATMQFDIQGVVALIEDQAGFLQ